MRFKTSRYVEVCVVLNFIGVLACTLYGGLRDGARWDTISDMISRDDRLRHGFVVYVILSCFVIAVALAVVVQRAMENHLLERPGYVYAIAVVYLITVGAYVAAAITSSDIDVDQHTSAAAVAFAGLLLVSAMLSAAQWSITKSKWWALGALAVAVGSGLAYLVTSTYYWEYVLVSFLHVTWLLLAAVVGDDSVVTMRESVSSDTSDRFRWSPEQGTPL